MLKEDNELQLDTIFRIVYDLRKNGKVIGFTHGAFDLFHHGQLYLLRESAKKCDFLVVGVESDENVRSYKNVDPIIPEKDRREVISELQCVNTTFIQRKKVVVDTYTELYKELSPDFVSYGRRFGTNDDLMREMTSKARVKTVKIDDDFFSSSEIVRRIKER